MHAGTLIKIASELATESGTLIHGSRRIPDKSLEQYWIASRCRLQRWQIDLKALEVDFQCHPDRFERIWRKAEPLMHEILQTEILTRVWSAILNGIEQMCPVRDCDSIGRNTLLGHLEARNRVLRIVIAGEKKDLHLVKRVIEMRNQTERWTDLLLSMVLEHADVATFGFNSDRVRGFLADRTKHRSIRQKNAFDAISLASLNEYYCRHECRKSSNSDLNRSLAKSVLSAIDCNLFRYSGTLMPLWQTRMLLTTNETCGALEELLQREIEQNAIEHPVAATHRRF